jgi:hypothetical protein
MRASIEYTIEPHCMCLYFTYFYTLFGIQKKLQNIIITETFSNSITIKSYHIQEYLDFIIINIRFI